MQDLVPETRGRGLCNVMICGVYIGGVVPDWDGVLGIGDSGSTVSGAVLFPGEWGRELVIARHVMLRGKEGQN
jgi:hypothetical protein